MLRSIRLAGWLSALVIALGPTLARADDALAKGSDAAKEEKPQPLHLSVTPSLDGPWKMVIANQGDKPMRVLADARLLTLEIIGAPEPPPDPDARDEHGKPRKKPPAAKPKGFPRGKIPVCKMPPEMRPPAGSSERALVLEPGDSYEETFDPIAFCGANALAGQLGVGAVIYPSFGWPEAHPHPRHKKKTAKDEPDIPPPPYVAESLKDPPAVPPIRFLEGPASIVMPAIPDADNAAKADADKAASEGAAKDGRGVAGKDAKGDASRADNDKADTPRSDASKTESTKNEAGKTDKKSDPATADKPVDARDMTKTEDAKSAKKDEPKNDVEPVDERAPRVEVSAHPHGDAGSAEDVSLTVTTKNVGKRTATLHLRTDDLAFRVVTPTGKRVDCNKEAEQRAAVRDFFETLREGHKKTMTVRLREICPTATFHRPGVYTVTPRLVLHDSGAMYRLTALVATAEAKRASKIRVRTGPLPYHPTKPVVATKPKPEPPPDEDDD